MCLCLNAAGDWVGCGSFGLSDLVCLVRGNSMSLDNGDCVLCLDLVVVSVDWISLPGGDDVVSGSICLDGGDCICISFDFGDLICLERGDS